MNTARERKTEMVEEGAEAAFEDVRMRLLWWVEGCEHAGSELG
jgi:hypothetical protein